MSALILTALLAIAKPLPAVAQEVHAFDISAQDSAGALHAFSVQSGLQILASGDDMQGKRLNALHGDVAVEDALNSLLAGTGLDHRYVSDRTVALVGATDETAPKKQTVQLEEVVVTGSHIRGAKNSASPIVIFDRDDIARSGVGSTEDFMRTVSQVFAGGASGSTLAGLGTWGGEGAANNLGSGTGLNLRGLGTKSTLVLLDGNRLSPSGLGESVDISVIPLAALERVEVLTDGASAIYGADAVGGVVNFITRKNFDGIETRLRYGAATAGSPDNVQVTQTFGHSWDSGNLMLTADVGATSKLDSRDREFTSTVPSPTDLLGRQSRRSALLSVMQRLGDRFELYGSSLASERRNNQTFNSSAYIADLRGSNTTFTGNTGVRIKLSDGWQADLAGSYGGTRTFSNTFLRPPYSFGTGFVGHASSSVADAKVDGKWFELPGGETRVALNAQFRHEAYRASGDARPTFSTLTRSVGAGSFEMLLPLVSQANARPGMAALQATVAARIEHYSDFGSSTNPKIGLLWMPVPGFSVRSTYGTSFRAPLLSELDEDSFRNVQALTLGDPTAADGTTSIIYRSGNNAALTPEKARNWTFGLSFSDKHASGLSGSLNYFRVDFKDRIAPSVPTALVRAVFSSEAVYGAAIERNPDLAEVVALFNTPGFFNQNGLAPTDIGAIVDNRLRNTTRRKVDGIDFDLAWKGQLAGGSIVPGLSGTRLLSLTNQVTPTTTALELLNTVYFPPQLRLRASLSWQKDAWDIGAFADFTDGYRDGRPVALFGGVMPRATVDSWTTLDMTVAYRIPDGAAGVLSGMRLSLSVQNLFDQDPPFVSGPIGLNFDPTNATAMGRYAAFELGMHW
ncbi:MAG: TonB-dependent receptor [Gammaproteobacteria bacterium]